MSQHQNEMNEFHWMLDMIQTIDVGLVVLDKDYQVQVWNNFMETHSGLRPDQAQGKKLFSLFPQLPEDWLRHKIDSVFFLKNRAFTTWEQRPHVFPFKNYRPITGTVDFMYQNITIIPLTSLTGIVTHISLIIYDVTDNAVNKLEAQKVNEELKILSRTDKLTQLYNRGYWQDRLEQEFNRFVRNTAPSSLVMFDIDHFKQVNDTYGHPAGDKIITLVGDTLRKVMRKTDIAGRYGGEEFGVILTDTDSEHAKIFCERLRTAIEALKPVVDGVEIPFTVSLGVAELDDQTASAKDWLANTDQALYQSKHNGRNETSLFAHKTPD